MRRGLIYAIGSLACLMVGAYFYSLLPGAAAPFVDIAPVQNLNMNAAAPEPEEKTTSLVFGGDVMLGRSVSTRISKNGAEYVFEKIKDLVSAADFAVANLEGPVTKLNLDPSNRMRFRFDPSMAQLLAMTGFNAVSLANNHGLDQGSKGFSDTEKNLAAAEVGYFGNASGDDGSVLTFMVNDHRFAIIGSQDVYRKIDPEVIGEKIAAAKAQGDFVIVYPHWGEEYKHEENSRQKELAHAFVDAGADMVVGSHPHVIQGIEIYKDKPIFYSLGNLVFDQYFSAETQEGLMLRLNVSTSGKTIDLLPYEIPQSQPVFAEREVADRMLTDLASWSDSGLEDEILNGAIIF